MALNKTISESDLAEPAVARMAGTLLRFAWGMLLRGQRFAVNGVSKLRWRIRWHKMWEYARGLALVPWRPDWRVIDFGGGATLPVYYLASRGLRVTSFDIDAALTAEAKEMAGKRGWPLEATTRDLTIDPLRDDETFDWAMSFCVLEHLPREKQLDVARQLGRCLRPGGYLTVTFDYGDAAPVGGALRGEDDVRALAEATGLQPVDGTLFVDSGDRFPLDKRHPEQRFTFGSLFLQKR
ncbi:MAG: class I SAM-dependent methyltransferase [Verrucomicrobiae bacterium]|nr:class I SAM-dependent methyltransferase [Verrucomicrobiae bacterium]